VSEPRLFVGDKVMERVAAALPKRGTTVAAVAYVTRDHLSLGHGDALAVNASASAVRSGATDPKLLLELQERDVIVVNQPMLHAKAVVRGGTVAIGSANLSERTSALQELMWVTKDPTLVRRTSAWLQRLLVPAPMERQELEGLIPLYRLDALPIREGRASSGRWLDTSPRPQGRTRKIRSPPRTCAVSGYGAANRTTCPPQAT